MWMRGWQACLMDADVLEAGKEACCMPDLKAGACLLVKVRTCLMPHAVCRACAGGGGSRAVAGAGYNSLSGLVAEVAPPRGSAVARPSGSPSTPLVHAAAKGSLAPNSPLATEWQKPVCSGMRPGATATYSVEHLNPFSALDGSGAAAALEKDAAAEAVRDAARAALQAVAGSAASRNSSAYKRAASPPKQGARPAKRGPACPASAIADKPASTASAAACRCAAGGGGGGGVFDPGMVPLWSLAPQRAPTANVAGMGVASTMGPTIATISTRIVPATVVLDGSRETAFCGYGGISTHGIIGQHEFMSERAPVPIVIDSQDDDFDVLFGEVM